MGQWLWNRRVENSRSLQITWDSYYPWRNPGEEFVLQAHIRNRTQQEREVRWQLPTLPGYPPIVDRGRVELWEPGNQRRTVTSPAPITPNGRIELHFKFRAIELGSGVLSVDLTESSGPHYQSYRGQRYPISVEARIPSGWASLTASPKEEFVARVLTQALERSSTRNLTRDRVVRFFDLVEAGQMTISPGATFQSFGGYTRAERFYLLSAAEARGLSVRWAGHSTPTHGWRRLFFYG